MIWSGNQEPVNRRPKDKETQSKESTAMRRGNLAGVLGGFHRHVEELLLRHAALPSLAPADFDSTDPYGQQQFWALASVAWV